MWPWIAVLLAAVSTAACLILWFRDVRRVMRERLDTVESAAGQLALCRKKAAEAKTDTTAAAILERSERIYQQAVELYDRTRRRPWNFVPAYLMGFRRLRPERENVQREDNGHDLLL